MDSPRLLRWDSALEPETGASVRVALLDSGLNCSLPMFKGAYLKTRDFTGSGGVFDPTGHGTKSAALLVSQGGNWLRGLVPACTLLMGKVLGIRDPKTSAVALSKGIRWAVDQQAQVLILPLGRTVGSKLVAKAVQDAISAQCQIFAAAGNHGPEVCLFPAYLSGVKAVSAVDLTGIPLSWCCQTARVDCYAPGHDLLAIGRSGSTLNGSSAATTLAAGVAALQIAREQRLKFKVNIRESPCLSTSLLPH
ncbi:MAG: S8 family peptidase [Spirulina sp.]